MIVLTNMMTEPRTNTVGTNNELWKGINGSTTVPATTDNVSRIEGMNMKNDMTTSIKSGVSIWPIWTSGSSEDAATIFSPLRRSHEQFGQNRTNLPNQN